MVLYYRGFTRMAGVLAVGASWLGVTSAAALATPTEARIGPAPKLPSGTTLVAGIASARTMKIIVALAPRDPAALLAYAQGVGNSSSPDYRHYLTPGQFRSRFAPARRTLVRVEAELRGHGLHPGAVSANGLAIKVQASSAAIERAFSLTLASVRLPSGRDALVNSQAPAVDAGVASAVQAVIGLNDLAPMHRLDVRHASAVPRSKQARGTGVSSAHIATGGPQPCVKAAQIAPGQAAYTADQVATAYDFSGLYRAGDFGQGVTIGAYELEPNAPSDIATYQSCYRTHARVSYEKVDRGAGRGSGQGEAALDIEQLIGLAPKANLIVYQGPNNNSDNPGTGPFDTLAAMISQDKVQVISNSWGECESLEGPADARAENTLLQEAAAQGQTFVTAAGDSGSEDCWSPPPGGNLNNSLTVDDPASQPFAMGVGGTSMTAIGPPPTESVWNDDDPSFNYARFGIQQGASGGGLSTLWPMPTFQSGAASTLGVTNSYSSAVPCGAVAGGYCREVPDVSADADPVHPYLDFWNGDGSQTRSVAGWQGTGGTSGAAPVWAALFALADASRDCAGTLIGFPNYTLYALASQSQATYFNDVTTGNNDFTPSGNTSGLYPATPGYDLASGLGTPKAAALAPALCQQTLKIHYPGNMHTFYRQNVRFKLHATPAPGQPGPLRFGASGLPIGLHINAATGVISGRPTRVQARMVTVTASTASQTFGAIRFTWAVERRPQVVAAASGTAAAPALTVTAQSGQHEPGLREVTINLPGNVTLVGGAAGVKVSTPGGRPLAHRAQLRGHVLAVTLLLAHSPLRIVFPAGLLRVRGSLTGGFAITVETVDRVGGRVTFRRMLRGA